MWPMHICVDDQMSKEFSWWVSDYQGIPLERVCEVCEYHKLKKYRPEILFGYNQSDVDEKIEEER
jgi:hypothetical protein